MPTVGSYSCVWAVVAVAVNTLSVRAGSVIGSGGVEAVGEAAVHVAEHDARVDVDALDRPVVDQQRDGVLAAGALAAADVGAGAGAGGRQVTPLLFTLKL